MPILESIANVRDLGGTVLPGGRTVRGGLLLRGGALSTASPEDLRTLRDRYKVAKIFDFRTSMELKYAPDPEIEGAKNIWLPAFDEASETFRTRNLPHDAYSRLGEYLVENARDPFVQDVAAHLYTDMVLNEFTQIQYAGFLQNILATPEGAVYWHCSQGKDRTGLGAAFLLAALGADREAIMRDYCLSAEFYAADLAKYIDLVETQEEKTVLRTFVSVNPRAFEAALDLIDLNYGSMEEFIKGPLCLDGADLDILRKRYLL